MKILFEHQHLYYLPQFEPIIIQLKKVGCNNLYGSLSVSVPKIEKDLFNDEMLRLGLEVVEGNFEPQRRRILKEMQFDIIFVGNKTSLGTIKSERSFSVMIYHGIGLKQSYYTDLSKKMDLICVESSSRNKNLQNMGFNSFETGFTKLDFLKKPDNIKIRKLSHPRVLYAPTFFPSSLHKTIPYLKKLTDFKIQIKLHHFFWTNPRYIKICSALKEEIKDLDHISLAPFEEYNILKFFPSSDLLISDFSSTIFEFLKLNRPIIQATYFNRRFKYKLFPKLLNKRMDQARESSINFTLKCDSPRILYDKINISLSNINALHTERLLACKAFLGNTNENASQKVLDAIISNGIPIGDAK